jgi:hypothetical protein
MIQLLPPVIIHHDPFLEYLFVLSLYAFVIITFASANLPKDIRKVRA